MEQAAKPRSGRAGVELAPAATRRNLEIRTAQDADIPAIVDLARRVYPGQLPYSTGQIRGQIPGQSDLAARTPQSEPRTMRGIDSRIRLSLRPPLHCMRERSKPS